mgnify:CR=1 FL=1
MRVIFTKKDETNFLVVFIKNRKKKEPNWKKKIINK